MKLIILSIFWLLFFFWLIRKLGIFKRSALSSRSLSFYFAAKLLCGLLLYLIYTHYYPYRNTSDAFKYYDDSQVVYKTLFNDPSAYVKIVTGIDSHDPILDKYYGQMETWYRDKTYNSWNDNRTIVRINALVSIFSGGVYFVHILFFCFLSFSGLLMLHTFITRFSPQHKHWAALLIFLSPSILFWSSGVLKEAIVFFALGGFLLNLSASIEKRTIRNPFYTLLFLLLLIILKIYILFSLIPALLFWFLAARAHKHGLRNAFFILLVGALGVMSYLSTEAGSRKLHSIAEKQKDFINISRGGAYLINCHSNDTIYVPAESNLHLKTADSAHYTLNPPMHFHRWTYWKILDTVYVSQPDTTCYTIYGVFGKTGSSFEITELRPEIASFMKMLPEAWRNVFFRPFFSEISSGLVAISFLENMLYFILACMFIFLGRWPDRNVISFILGSIIFALLLAAIIGFVTPVTGAIVRYRIPMLPFILCSLLLIADPVKVNRLLPRKLFRDADET